MSPEQAQGAKVDHRVDVYAVGVIMYELLTGRVPFTADTFMGILTKHMFEVPEAPSAVCPTNPIPPEAEAIVLKALQKDKNYRFQSMREMAEAIEAVGTGAAAVAVVSENIVRPQTTGEMLFVGGATGTTAPPIMPGAAGGYEEPRRSGGGLMYGIIGAVVLAGAGAGIFFALNSNKAEPAPTVAAADAGGEKKPEEAPKAAEPKVETPTVPPAGETPPTAEAAPQQKVIAAAIPKVKIFIDTDGVDAEILDPRDTPYSIYGRTNTPEGIEVEKSDEAVKFVLRADGYEDFEVELTPNRDGKKIEVDLKKKATKKTSSGSKSGSKTSSGGSNSGSGSGSTTTTPPPEDKTDGGSRAKPPVTTPDDKKKGGKTVGSPDLKDPFGKR
jgi:serine/threonine-protein kinase